MNPNLPWWSIALVMLAVLGGILNPSPQSSSDEPEAPAAPSVDHTDFDLAMYQRRVGNQTRRLEALDAGLFALAALQFGAMLYIGVDAHGESWPFRTAAFVIGGCVLLDLLAIIGFRGDESPDLDDFATLVATKGRDAAVKKTMEDLTLNYRQNGHVLNAKERIVRWGGGLSGLLVLLVILYRVLH